MIEKPGTSVLYREATALERSMADTDAERLLSVRAELIVENWDPFKVQWRNINHLAFNLGVTLWEDDWSEADKRRWLDMQWAFKAKVGTPAATDIALGMSGFRVQHAVEPPQGFYATPSMTPEEWDAWIRLMPQVRIKLEKRHGTSPGDLWFAGDGCVGLSAPGPDYGPVLYGRQAIVRYADGTEQDLLVAHLETTVEDRAAIDYEQIVTPGKSTDGWFEGDFAGEAHYAGAAEVEPHIHTVSFDRTYQHETSGFHLSSIVPGLEPMRVQYERNSDIGDGSLFFFAGDFARGPWTYAGANEAGELLADRVYLHDPAVAAPMLVGVSFAGYDRVGIPPKYSELLIDLDTHENGEEWFAGDATVGERFASHTDSRQIDKALRAVVEAKAVSDTIWVSFETVIPLRVGDPITETTLLGEQRRAFL